MNNNKSSKVLAQIHFKKLVETSSVEDFKTLKELYMLRRSSYVKEIINFWVLVLFFHIFGI